MEGFVNGLLDMAFGENLITSLGDVLFFDTHMVLNNIISISEIVNPIAGVLLCIYLVLEIMEKVTEGNFTAEQFLKMLIKLAFGSFLINNATAFVLWFSNIGVSLMNDIIRDNPMSTLKMGFEVENIGMIDALGMFVMLAIPAAIGFVMQIAVKIMGYARNIEIIVRAMFAPIGVADVMHGGANAHGIKYLKDCLALAIQGAIMMGVMIAGMAMAAALFGANIEFNLMHIVQYFGVLGGMIGLLGQSKTIAKEIVG